MSVYIDSLIITPSAHAAVKDNSVSISDNARPVGAGAPTAQPAAAIASGAPRGYLSGFQMAPGLERLFLSLSRGELVELYLHLLLQAVVILLKDGDDLRLGKLAWHRLALAHQFSEHGSGQ